MNIKTLYTSHVKKQIEERSRPIDTTQLQLDSVMLFMEEFGYGLHHPQKDSLCAWKGFIKRIDVEGVNLPKCISFQDACRLHNTGFISKAPTLDAFIYRIFNINTSLYYSFNFDTYFVARKSKLVEKVYLQRKGKMVECQQHWVKFVD